MFAKLGRSVAHHPWRVVVSWLIIVGLAVAGAFWGYGEGGLFDRMSNSPSLVRGSDSDDVNEMTAKGGGETMTVVVEGLDLDKDIPKLIPFMADRRGDLAGVDGVRTEADPFLAGVPTLPQLQALLSDDSDGFLVALTLDDDLVGQELKDAQGRVTDAVNDFKDGLREDFGDETEVHLLYTEAFTDAIIGQLADDLVRGEAVGLPIALLLLVIVFGGLIAAGLPIIGALVSIGIGMGALWAITFTADVESFILNVVSIVGLALSIDYGLLVVSRYREELARALASKGYPSDGSRVPRKFASREIVREAVVATVKTAGRTVFFSALTIAMSMVGLVAMEADLLKIIAAGGIVVTLLAVLTAITLVPALIVILNRRLVKPSVITRIPGLRSIVKTVGDSASDRGFFSRLAHGVHKIPWLIMIGVFAILGVLAVPLYELQARTAFMDYLPDGHDVTLAYDAIQANYPALQAASIVVVADAAPIEVGDLVKYLSDFDDVDFVSQPTSLDSDRSKTTFSVHIKVENQVGAQITQDVKDLRAHEEKYDFQVGGPAALQLDFVDSVVAGAPIALTVIISAVFLLLFLMTGSIAIPIKALIINSLSLLASLGATTFIFMNGYLGMPKVLGMETFVLAVTACFGFGLAMDYEVFLVARIKEYWDKGESNDEAVEHGLQRSGRIITSAAAIIVAVFIGFTTGDMVAIKEIGVAMAATVLIDATLVRMLLVPATMTILGRWNWWAPPPLRRLYEKFHIVH
ncbi:MAG: MMPL family transporter [Propionibacteriaceae bacterium]|jgi:RND superfamily putative drug exporter|nr:MMPL family transporter [Propionibacteriaceae bacterium]